MNVLSLEKLLTKKERRPASVPTPEIEKGSNCFILAPTPDQRDLAEVQWGSYRSDSNVGFRKFLIAWCLVDAENQQIIPPGNENALRSDFIEAMEALGESLPMQTAARLFDVAMRKMGMNADDVKELEKNSDPIPSDDGSGTKPSQLESAAELG